MLDDFWVFRAYVVWAYISLVWLLCLVCEFDLIGGRCGGVWWWFVIRACWCSFSDCGSSSSAVDDLCGL